MQVIATPDDICQCGHKKTYHVWLRSEHQSVDEPLVKLASCGFAECGCTDYVDAGALPAGARKLTSDGARS